MTTKSLEERIAEGRDRKARRYARALWDRWPEGTRAAKLAEIEAAPRDFWLLVAEEIGAREPSPDTVAVILAKLRTAVATTP